MCASAPESMFMCVSISESILMCASASGSMLTCPSASYLLWLPMLMSSNTESNNYYTQYCKYCFLTKFYIFVSQYVFQNISSEATSIEFVERFTSVGKSTSCASIRTCVE